MCIDSNLKKLVKIKNFGLNEFFQCINFRRSLKIKSFLRNKRGEKRLIKNSRKIK